MITTAVQSPEISSLIAVADGHLRSRRRPDPLQEAQHQCDPQQMQHGEAAMNDSVRQQQPGSPAHVANHPRHQHRDHGAEPANADTEQKALHLAGRSSVHHHSTSSPVGTIKPPASFQDWKLTSTLLRHPDDELRLPHLRSACRASDGEEL